MEGLPFPNGLTAFLLGFNLWGGERCQQNACSERRKRSWNLARTTDGTFVELSWVTGTLLEPWLEHRWNLLETFGNW